MRVCFRWRSVRFACFVVCGGLFFFVLFVEMYRDWLISIYRWLFMYIERGFCVCIGDYFILSKNIGGCQRKGFGTVWNKNKKKGWCYVPCGYGCIGANVILSKK